MKRLLLLLVAVALLWPGAASAQLTMQMSNGWSFAFSGNVNAFWVFSKVNNSGPANSSVRTGLLPAFATFEAKGKEAGMNLAVHFGFAPQIQNAGVHDNFGNGTQAGAQIDMRQVYLTVGGQWGQILSGRELGLFGRQAILNDMTLFGVGAVGIGAGQSGGTTLGRIGYGYLYPNFDAQVTYSTRAGRPGQLSIGAFQPSVLLGDRNAAGTCTVVATCAFVVTKIPRVEAEFTYNQKSGKNKYMFWAGGLWQSTSNAASLLFSGGERAGTAATSTELRSSDGGYVQLGYTLNKKTTVGASWGYSRLKNSGAAAPAGDGNTAVRTNVYSFTGGVYHQWTKSLKLVFEGTQEGTTNPGRAKQIDLSGGFMLFF